MLREEVPLVGAAVNTLLHAFADFLAARPLLLQAVEKDKNFALAYWALAKNYSLMAVDGYARPAEAWPMSLAYARQALGRLSLADLAVLRASRDHADQESRRAPHGSAACRADRRSPLVLCGSGRHARRRPRGNGRARAARPRAGCSGRAAGKPDHDRRQWPQCEGRAQGGEMRRSARSSGGPGEGMERARSDSAP